MSSTLLKSPSLFLGNPYPKLKTPVKSASVPPPLSGNVGVELEKNPSPWFVTCIDSIAPAAVFVKTFAVAFVVGSPPPGPPFENTISSLTSYPVPPEFIVTSSKNPIPLFPPSITQSR